MTDAVPISFPQSTIDGAIGAASAGRRAIPPFAPIRPNAGREHASHFNRYRLSTGRVSYEARHRSRVLARARRRVPAFRVREAEAALSAVSHNAASSSAFAMASRVAYLWRDDMREFYVVSQQARHYRYIALCNRQALYAHVRSEITVRFGLLTLPAFLAVGTWRSAGGFHCRGQYPAISARLRRELAKLPNVVIVPTPEPYALVLCRSLFSSIHLMMMSAVAACGRWTTHKCPICRCKMSKSGYSGRKNRGQNARGVRRCTSAVYAIRRLPSSIQQTLLLFSFSCALYACE
jgi:hypothetical protein